MTEALRTLLSGAIDYAGLFPPAALDMPSAARNYAAYRAGPHAWALGRFIVPSARLNEVDPDWKFVVLGVPPRAVEVCEMKVEHAEEAVPLLADPSRFRHRVFRTAARRRPRAASRRTRTRQGAHRWPHAGCLPRRWRSGALDISLRGGARAF